MRVKDDPRLDYNGTQMKAKAIADELEFVKTREVIDSPHKPMQVGYFYAKSVIHYFKVP